MVAKIAALLGGGYLAVRLVAAVLHHPTLSVEFKTAVVLLAAGMTAVLLLAGRVRIVHRWMVLPLLGLSIAVYLFGILDMAGSTASQEGWKLMRRLNLIPPGAEMTVGPDELARAGSWRREVEDLVKFHGEIRAVYRDVVRAIGGLHPAPGAPLITTMAPVDDLERARAVSRLKRLAPEVEDATKRLVLLERSAKSTYGRYMRNGTWRAATIPGRLVVEHVQTARGGMDGLGATIGEALRFLAQVEVGKVAFFGGRLMVEGQPYEHSELLEACDRVQTGQKRFADLAACRLEKVQIMPVVRVDLPWRR